MGLRKEEGFHPLRLRHAPPRSADSTLRLFLTGMQGSGPCWPGFRAWGPAQAAEMQTEPFHGTVQLRLRKPSKALQGQRTGGYGSVLRPGPMHLRRNKKLKTWLAGSQPVRVAGSRPQGPVGQVSRGLGARARRAWGPAHQAPGAFPHKNHQITIFSQTSWWEPGEGVGVTAASEVGTWRETKPGHPPYPQEEGFHPLRLRQPSNTPPKVGGPKITNPKPLNP